MVFRADRVLASPGVRVGAPPGVAVLRTDGGQQVDASERVVRLVFTPHGWEDYTFWLAADRNTLKRINRLIDDALRDPTAGIGKPEPLRHLLAGAWSRRISEEHRLVYLVDGDYLVVLQARYHYK